MCKAQLIKFTFAMLRSKKIHICKAQLINLHLNSQSSALIKFMFAKLSSHKINIPKAQLSYNSHSKLGSHKM